MDIYEEDIEEIVPEESGTTFYYITEDDLLKFYDKSDNCILRYIVENEGFDAFDLEKLYGSELFGDIFYLCVTDGNEIMIDGEMVAPEEVLAMYAPEDISEYEKHGNDGIIRRYLSEYEMKEVDLDDVAFDMINDGYADFTEIVKCAVELDWLDI